MIYGLEENIKFGYTSYYHKYSRKVLGFYADNRGQKEFDLTRRINIILNTTIYKLKTIHYMKNQFDSIDNALYQINESAMYSFSEKVKTLKVIWAGDSIEDSFYEKRLAIVDEIQVLREKIDSAYSQSLEDRKKIGLQVVDNCLHGQKINFMKIDMCLPIFEGYREFVYRFYTDNKTIGQFNSENETRLKFSEKLINIIELLKNVKHQDDEVFINLSEEAQKYYKNWYVYFNRPDKDSLEARQQYLEAVTVIETVIKNEIEKYNQYLKDADEEKARILQEAESEKQQELQAEIENQSRIKDFEQEESERKKVHENNLQEQLILVDLELDRQFQEAKKEIEASNAKEIQELELLYPSTNIKLEKKLSQDNLQQKNNSKSQQNSITNQIYISKNTPDPRFFDQLIQGISGVIKRGKE